MGFVLFLILLVFLLWVITYPFRKYNEIKERNKKEKERREREKRKNKAKKFGINKDPHKYPVFKESSSSFREDSYSKLEEIGTRAREGRSEEILYSKMKEEFEGSKVFHGGVKFYPKGKPEFRTIAQVHHKLEEEGRDFAYYPDISYIDEEEGVSIDIEVDEPYVINNGSKKPIHFIYESMSGEGVSSADDERNGWFISNGWNILRFSENQVKKYPKECCRYVKRVINCIRSEPYPTKEMSSPIPLDDRWTSQEARQMDR